MDEPNPVLQPSIIGDHSFVDWPKKSGETSSQFLFAVSRTLLANDSLTLSAAELDCKSPLCKGQVPFLPRRVFERQFATTFLT